MSGAFYALYQITWEQFMKMVEKDVRDGGLVARPVAISLRPDYKFIGFWPTPDKDYEARVQYATIKEI